MSIGDEIENADLGGCLYWPFWLVAISAQEIRFNFLPATDFASTKPTSGSQYPDQILDTQIKQAIKAYADVNVLTQEVVK
jgi:hypothetical protein